MVLGRFSYSKCYWDLSILQSNIYLGLFSELFYSRYLYLIIGHCPSWNLEHVEFASTLPIIPTIAVGLRRSRNNFAFFFFVGDTEKCCEYKLMHVVDKGFTGEPLRQAVYDKDTTHPMLQQDYKVIPHSTPLTLNWLSENYECAEGVCIPRSVVYRHYCDFCEKNGMIPVNPASFGKVRPFTLPIITIIL